MGLLDCRLLVLLACIGVRTAGAADGPPANRICPQDALELFSCKLERGPSVGICLDKPSLRMRFARRVDRHPVSLKTLGSVWEATIGENAHGDQIVLRAAEPGRMIELFIDGDYYDMDPPILVTKTGGHDMSDVCRPDTLVENHAVLKVNGEEKPVNLFSLERDGIAETLREPPTWPKLKEGSAW